MKNEDITKLLPHDSDKVFRMLFDNYKEPLYWHIRRLVVSHADAQDALQNTFVRIYRSLGSLINADSLVAWIYRIATNEALRVVKDESHILSRLDEPEACEVKADNYVDYSDLEAVRLQKAILSLPQKQRIAFTMRYYDNLDFSDIAKVTGSSAASAKVNYHVAKNKIISYMTSTD